VRVSAASPLPMTAERWSREPQTGGHQSAVDTQIRTTAFVGSVREKMREPHARSITRPTTAEKESVFGAPRT